MEKNTKILFILATAFVVIISYLVLSSGITQSRESAFAMPSSLTIITLSNDNMLIGGGQFLINPNPFTNAGNYTIKDNSSVDSEKDKDGVITLSGINAGNYAISQISAAPGYGVDRIQKVVQVKDSSSIATFTDIPTSSVASASSLRSITYTAKFECGSIYAGEGPLRPGHYDSDISIFNKQKYQSTILWNAIVNNGSSSNAILINMNSETAKSITCKDVRTILGNNNDNFVEGFLVIDVPLDSSFGNKGTTITSLSQDDINVLDVQAFYTANALDMLPHEAIVDKISFYIIQDYSGKIPKDILKKSLDVSVPSTLNEVSDTEMKVKKSLAKQYNLSNDDLSKIVVRIKDVSVGVGVLIDDHAISLSTIKPQLSQ